MPRNRGYGDRGRRVGRKEERGRKGRKILNKSKENFKVILSHFDQTLT
jgi:hypothetical protein